jgi:alpha-N-arabinofuranosidase
MALVKLDPNRPALVSTRITANAIGRILTGTELDTHNTFEQPERLTPRAFSGRTTDDVVFDLPAKIGRRSGDPVKE